MLPRPMSEASTPIRWNRLSPYVRMATWRMEPPTSPPRTGVPIKKRPAMIRAFPTAADAAGTRQPRDGLASAQARTPTARPGRPGCNRADRQITNHRMISGQRSFVKCNYGQRSSIVLLYTLRSESRVNRRPSRCPTLKCRSCLYLLTCRALLFAKVLFTLQEGRFSPSVSLQVVHTDLTPDAILREPRDDHLRGLWG